jgi:uncharacterized membrane protein YgcG
MSHDPNAFGRRQAKQAQPKPLLQETGVGPFLTKRSTAITLVLAGSAAFLAYNVSFSQTCKAPPPGASPELLAEYERCRSRRSSSNSGSSHSAWSSGSSSSSAGRSTASRGGFGSTASGHAGGG